MVKIKGWKLIDKVNDKDDNWEKYSDGHNQIDIWRREANHWNVTINGSFLTQGSSKGDARKSMLWYMKKHPIGRKNNPNWNK